MVGCSSPKNQFEKGNYEKAVQLSIKKLRKKPSNEKQKSILKAAYNYAVQVSTQKITQYQQSNDRFKWDSMITQYRQMQNLYAELLQCPGCLSVVTPVDYQVDLNAALLQGAQVAAAEEEQAGARRERRAAQDRRSRHERVPLIRGGCPTQFLQSAKLRDSA